MTDEPLGLDQLPASTPLRPIADEPGEPRRTATLRGNSLARLAADGSQLVASLVAGTITARVLGPAGKGFYSSLVLLGGLFAHLFNGGLGESTIVFANRGRATLQTVVSSTLAAVTLLGMAGCAVLYVVGDLVLNPNSANYKLALVLACATLLVNIFGVVSSSALIAQERVVPVGVLGIVAAVLSTALLWPLLIALHLSVAGAIAASLLGVLVALVATLALLKRANVSLRPRWNAEYLAAAMRFGAVVQVANILMLMTGRLDLLLVYHLASAAAAGNYSIALTVGALAGSIPLALVYAAFPRMAHLPDPEARNLIGQVTRIGLLAATLSGAGLALITPVAIPFVFGAAYRPAVSPTLILIVGGVLGSGQWLLARSATALGLPRVVLTSYATSVAVMVTLDILLIPPFGINGAAVAALISQLVGVIVALVFYLRWGWGAARFVPRSGDLAYLVTNAKQLLRREG